MLRRAQRAFICALGSVRPSSCVNLHGNANFTHPPPVCGGFPAALLSGCTQYCQSAGIASLSNLSPGSKGRKYRKRRCRGGGDKRAGRGNKGQKSRSGTGKPALFFTGGQTPFWKSLPKRGFTPLHRRTYDNVTLLELEAAVRLGKLNPRAPITMAHLYQAGLLEKKAYNRDGVLLLAKRPDPSKIQRLNKRLHCVGSPPLGEQLSLPLRLEVAKATRRAKDVIEAIGGELTTVYYNRLGMRALLQPEWFAKKGRLVPRGVRNVPLKMRGKYDQVGIVPWAGARPAELTMEALLRTGHERPLASIHG